MSALYSCLNDVDNEFYVGNEVNQPDTTLLLNYPPGQCCGTRDNVLIVVSLYLALISLSHIVEYILKDFVL